MSLPSHQLKFTIKNAKASQSNHIKIFSRCQSSSSIQTINFNSHISIPKNSRIFSLIQPSNKFHIGNYLGTLKIWRDLVRNPNVASSESSMLFGLADLHALTSPKDPKVFLDTRMDAVATILASGIDPEVATVFAQSCVPEHSELFWILCCLTGMGSLNRMTQWKAKSAASADASVFDTKVMSTTSSGVFMYPVLQAADILLYKSTLVPVGDDQAQHLELSRNIAQSFNKAYEGFQFPLPKTVLAPTKKILSLRDPAKKMSKSDPDKNSCVFITDNADVIAKKVRKAVTDSIMGPITFDPLLRPGVSNLVTIVSGMQDCSVDEALRIINDVEKVRDHKMLKDYVTSVVVETMHPVKSTYEALMADRGYLEEVINKGSERAREIAGENMKTIKKAVGLA